MASAAERLKIIENVIARVGLDGDVLGEYSRAMSALNNLQTFNEMNPPIPQNLPPEQPMSSPQGELLPPKGQNEAISPDSENPLSL